MTAIATAPTRTRRPMPQTDEEWHDLLLLLPGYDPYEDAGDCTFDPEAATRIIDFFETMLTHTKGSLADTPFLLEDWQRCFFANLFGWKMSTGFRRFVESLLYVPKKNGKSPMGGGLGIYLLVADGEKGAEVYSIASDKDQAAIVFGYAEGMVQNEPELDSRIRLFKNRSMVHYESKSKYVTIPADAAGSHGFQISGVIADELHTMPDSKLVHSMIAGTANRDQPIVLWMTTADYDGKSACNDKLHYAERVRDGVIKDRRFLPAIWKADRNDDWTDPKVWARVNPNLGVSVTLDYMERACQSAIADPVWENEFKRLHLNMPTEQAVRWIRMDQWDACDGSVTDEELKGCPCWLGIDLSSTRDITAVCAVWRLPDEQFAARWWFWVPAESMERRQREDHAPFVVWEREGLIEKTEGAVVDYNRARAVVVQIGEDHGVQLVALDPYNATMLAAQLSEEDGFEVEFFRQGYLSMSPACKTMDRIIGARRLRHGGNPVARWMASNVAVTMDPAENIKMVKPESYGRIDGMIALVMALARADEGDVGFSAWNTEGMVL